MSRVLVLNGIMSVRQLCLNFSLNSSPPPIRKYTPNYHLSVLSPRRDMTCFGVSWSSLFRRLTPRYHSNNLAGIRTLTFFEFGQHQELYFRLQAKNVGQRHSGSHDAPGLWYQK